MVADVGMVAGLCKFLNTCMHKHLSFGKHRRFNALLLEIENTDSIWSR